MRPPVHAVPQPPQLAPSCCRSTHTPLQLVRPGTQQLTFTFVTSTLPTMPAGLATVQIWVAGCVVTATEYAAPGARRSEKEYEPFATRVSGSVPLFVSET